MAVGNITIQFSEEDRERLDRLADMLEQLGALQTPKTELNAMNVPPVTEPETAPEQEPEAEPEEPTYTAADIQAKVQHLASPACGKRNEVKALVREYAERVSLIPEDKYNEVMRKLIELEEG